MTTAASAPARRRKKTPAKPAALAKWSFACPDWEKRLYNGEIPTNLNHILPMLNMDRVTRARAIFERLKLSDVPGQPLLRDACGDWFWPIVEVMAGGVNPSGKQNVRDCFVLVPKKNSKTSYGGLLLLTLMLMSPRPRAEFVCVAPTLEISQLAFNQIAGAVYSDETLRERLHVREHLKTIVDRKSGCKLSCKSFSLDIATGSRPAVVLLDEVWLLTHPDAPRIIGQLRGGQAAIPESCVIQITTQSDRAPVGYFKSELSKARAVRDGTADLDGYWPILFEPPGDLASTLEGVASPETWALVNPNIGRSVDLDWLKSSFQEARLAGEEETRRWLSQHTNAEVTLYTGAGDDAWSAAEAWAQGADTTLTLESVIENASRIAIGVDGGGSDDLLSVAVLGEAPGGAWQAWTRSWVWPIALERRQSIASLLRDFERDGDLIIAEAGDDLLQVVDFILEVQSTGKVISIGMDPAGIAADLAQHLCEYDAALRNEIVAVSQGYKLRPAYIGLERRLRQGTFHHGGQPILDWAVSNAMVDPKSGLLTKKMSGVGKIDPLVALASAAMCALEAAPPLPDDLAHWIG